MPVTEWGTSDNFEAVTPANANLASPTRYVYVGTTGNLNVTPAAENATPVIIRNIPAGTILEMSVVRISSSDTSASNVIAFY